MWCVYGDEEFAPLGYWWLGSQSVCQLTLLILSVSALINASCEVWDGSSGRCGGVPNTQKNPLILSPGGGREEGVGCMGPPHLLPD